MMNAMDARQLVPDLQYDPVDESYSVVLKLPRPEAH
jgi:hypothetical protein